MDDFEPPVPSSSLEPNDHLQNTAQHDCPPTISKQIATAPTEPDFVIRSTSFNSFTILHTANGNIYDFDQRRPLGRPRLYDKKSAVSRDISQGKPRRSHSKPLPGAEKRPVGRPRKSAGNEIFPMPICMPLSMPMPSVAASHSDSNATALNVTPFTQEIADIIGASDVIRSVRSNSSEGSSCAAVKPQLFNVISWLDDFAPENNDDQTV